MCQLRSDHVLAGDGKKPAPSRPTPVSAELKHSTQYDIMATAVATSFSRKIHPTKTAFLVCDIVSWLSPRMLWPASQIAQQRPEQYTKNKKPDYRFPLQYVSYTTLLDVNSRSKNAFEAQSMDSKPW